MAFGATVDVSTLNGTNGFKITGDGGRLGWAVSGAGDFNNDGFADLLLGAYNRQVSGQQAGAVYVVFGKASGWGANIAISSLDGSTGFRIDGQRAQARFGFDVTDVGDINGDGFDDLAIGAPYDQFGYGAAYLVYGRSGAVAPVQSASALFGANGALLPNNPGSGRSGYTVDGAGDFNGDGQTDLIVGAWSSSVEGATRNGASYIYFGGGGSARIAGPTTMNAYAGFDVANAGDFNGDGFDDLLISSNAYNLYGTPFSSGISWLVFGGASLPSNLAQLDGSNGFRIESNNGYSFSGRTLSSAGDINGDGFDDVILYSRGAGINRGGVYVVFGSDATQAPVLNLSSIDGTNGFRIEGLSDYGALGQGMSAAGDVNNDGIDDFIVAAPNSFNGTGRAYVVFGRTTGFGASLDLAGLNGANGFEIVGTYGGYFGHSVSGAGDVNNDGFDDILVGAGAEGGDLGAAYVIFGQASGAVPINQTGGAGDDTLDGGTLGDSLNGGDGKDTLNGLDGADTLNGDGGNDVLNGGAGADTLDGGAGNDIMNGGAGADVMTDAGGSNKFFGGDGNDIITAGTGADRVDGEADDDTIDGGAGNDYLDGGSGVNSLTGGLGNDVFIVRSSDDTVIEAASEGIDTVRAFFSYSLTDNVEALELQGTGDLDGTGNALGNTIKGNDGANVLSGGDGADKIDGGAGADTIIGGVGRDILTGGAGADTFRVLGESMKQPVLEVDKITDFGAGDRLDFSAIDANGSGDGDAAFAIVTGPGFTHTAGELFMFYTLAQDITTIRLDIDGDAVADYQLSVNGNVTGASANWLL